MKFYQQAFLLAVVTVGLGSCSDDNPWRHGGGQGMINLNLSPSAEVKDAVPMVRAGAPELDAPEASAFAVSLLNLDTEEVRTWTTMEEFNSEAGFDVGSYTLSAYYGNIEDCGFNKPYFYGEANVNVIEGRESSVDVTARLANAMVSIDYTEAFKGYFSEYSVEAHTSGHANVLFSRMETRPGFLTPGDVTLRLNITNPSGKTATITPAQFPAAACHHYHVTFDVNADPAGDAVLSVIFDDSLTQKNVTISLSDELYNAEAPVVAAEGFRSGEMVEVLAGNPSSKKLKFETVCKSGLKEAWLKISGPASWQPSFGRELDLVQADDATQYQLEQNGIKVHGLFKNPEQMAIVDLTDLPRFLPEGNFEITLTVTDNLGRNNESPVSLNLTTRPIVLSFVEGSAIYAYPGTTQTTTPTVDATVTMSYNGLNPAECISFKNKCRYGKTSDCTLVSVEESTLTRAFEAKNYLFHIKVCDAETSPLPMEVWFNGVKYGEFVIDVIEPEFSLQEDVFATYARFKVTTEDPADLPTIINGLTIFKNGVAQGSSEVVKTPESGMITLNGLAADADYEITYSLTDRGEAGIPDTQTLNIHTETAYQIPNGDFSQTSQLKVDNLQVGGEYRNTAAIWHRNHSSIDRQVPSGVWNTINSLTCDPTSNPLNTWFVVPSTYVESGRAVILNVGYSHNGTVPSRSGNAANTTYYNTNAPTFKDSEKVSGELFLYDFNANKDGMALESRPKSVSFEYMYEPLSGDAANVSVQVLDASGNVISSASDLLEAEDQMTRYSVKLPQYDFGKKAAAIKVKFKSSNQTIAPITIPTGNALNDGASKADVTIEANKYHAVATGSKLTIDNVKLNY